MNKVEMNQKYNLKEKPSVVLNCSNLQTEVIQSDSDTCEINLYMEINEENNYTADRLIESEYSEETNELSIKIPASDINLKRYKGRIEALIPNGANLEVSTSNGSIRVADLTAALSLNSTNGSVTADTIFGNVKAKTLNGSISMNKINGSISTEVMNGGTKIENSVSEINSKSMNGSININETVFTGVEVENNNGRITLVVTDECSGKVKCSNQNGRIHVAIPEDQTFNLTAVNRFGGIKNKLPDHCSIEKKVGKSRLQCIRSGGDVSEKLDINLENRNGSILLTDDLHSGNDSKAKIKFEDINLDINLDGISDFVNKTVNTAVNEVNKFKDRFNIDFENLHIPEEKRDKVEKRIKKVVGKMRKKIKKGVDDFCFDEDDENLHDIVIDIEHEIDDELEEAKEDIREAFEDAREDIADAEEDIREAMQSIKEAGRVLRDELKNLGIPEEKIESVKAKLDRKNEMLREKLHDVKRVIRKKKIIRKPEFRDESVMEPGFARDEYRSRSRKDNGSVKLQILKLLEDGKISVDEADRLLKSV